MPQLNLTPAELAVIKQAVETFNDMSNDMMFENISINLYPNGDDVTTINSKRATILRTELNEAIRTRETVVAVMYKIGSNINDNGYSV